MVDIDFYCRVYDNFLEPDVCQAYIDMFEETLTVDADKHQRLSVCYDQNGDKVCGDCDCYRTNPFEYERFGELNQYTMKKMPKLISNYRDDCNITKTQWPENLGFEEPKMKRFKIDGTKGHGLESHSDIWSFAGAKRLIGMLVYLNDDFSEGETYFPLFDVKVKPAVGRVLCFPSSWDYMHAGIPPRPPARDIAKYFLMFHTVYLDEDTEYRSGIDRTDRNSLDNYDYLGQ